MLAGSNQGRDGNQGRTAVIVYFCLETHINIGDLLTMNIAKMLFVSCDKRSFRYTDLSENGLFVREVEFIPEQKQNSS